MRECHYVIKGKCGLHARNAAALAMVCRKLRCETLLFCRGIQVDAKNPVELLGLGAVEGDEVKLLVNGEDEDEVVKLWKEYCERNL